MLAFRIVKEALHFSSKAASLHAPPIPLSFSFLCSPLPAFPFTQRSNAVLSFIRYAFDRQEQRLYRYAVHFHLVLYSSRHRSQLFHSDGECYLKHIQTASWKVKKLSVKNASLQDGDLLNYDTFLAFSLFFAFAPIGPFPSLSPSGLSVPYWFLWISSFSNWRRQHFRRVVRRIGR